MRQIQEDVNLIFRQAADTLSDKSKIPYMEFAAPVLTNLANRFSAYRESVGNQELRAVCDTIYANRIKELYGIESSIPRYGDLYEQGRISRQERDFYTNLILSKKPFVPYTK